MESSEEEVGGDEDDNEVRVVNNSDHDSNSCLEYSSFEDSDSDDDNIELEYFIGKDKATKWSKTPLTSKFAKTKKKNIINITPGSKFTTEEIQNEVGAFHIIFSDKMIDEIIHYTNMYISTVQKNYKRDRDAKFITKNEMMAFFGLLFLSGIKKGNHTNFLELWATDGTGIEVFRACMSCNRFLFILNSIRFDDKTTRNDRRSEDKLTAVRSMLDQFVYNCKTSYCLSEYLTIDEMLVPFRGRCSFIQYIPSKPAKYGLKIFALVDAKSFYTGNLEIYCGTQPDGPYNMSSKPFDIVMRLLGNVTGSNRNLTCDNWYTSYPLATELLKKQTTIVGTLRKNKKEIPADFQPHKNKAINSSFFGFQKEIMITSYTPKKNKAVILLSTMHNDTSVNSETKKPEVIHFYNSTKGGVDTVDQMCGNYSVSRRTRRWPLSIFFQLLNIAGINANILYNNTQIEKKHKNRRSFLKSLSMNLMNNHLSERSQMANLPTDIKHFLSKYETKEVDVQEPPTKIRSRCYLCGRAKNRVTTIKCSSCQKFTCKEHVKAVVRCERCISQDSE